MNRPKKGDFICQDGIWMRYDNLAYIQALNDYIDQLEKAFDRACGELEYYDNHMFGVLPTTKEQWKEWCLKNE